MQDLTGQVGSGQATPRPPLSELTQADDGGTSLPPNSKIIAFVHFHNFACSHNHDITSTVVGFDTKMGGGGQVLKLVVFFILDTVATNQVFGIGCLEFGRVHFLDLKEQGPYSLT